MLNQFLFVFTLVNKITISQAALLSLFLVVDEAPVSFFACSIYFTMCGVSFSIYSTLDHLLSILHFFAENFYFFI